MDNNKLTFDWTMVNDYTPLPDGATGLLGQIGELRRNDNVAPIYDPDAPVWELEDGRKWEHRTACYACGAPTEDVLCYDCTLEVAEQGERRQAQDRRTTLLMDALGVGALPSWWREWTPPSLTPQQAAAMLTIESRDGVSVWIHGRPGRGKTILACTLLYHAWQRCRRIALCKSTTLMDSRFNRALHSALCNADLLLIDDIEKGILTEVGVAAIHAVLDARHDAHHRTIVTSERTAADVHQAFVSVSGTQYGISTLSRLTIGRHKPLTIELDGPNLRRESA